MKYNKDIEEYLAQANIKPVEKYRYIKNSIPNIDLNEFTFEAMFHSIAWDLKDKKYIRSKIANGYTKRTVNLDNFCKAMNKGYTFVPSLMVQKNHRDNKLKSQRHSTNFDKTQIIALDFDDGVTPFDAVNKLENMGFNVNAIYYTSSHTDEAPRFRLVMVFDDFIVNGKVFKDIMTKLIQKVQGDGSCNDVCRAFFGGRNATLINPTINSLSGCRHIFDSLKDDDYSKTNKSKVSKFTDKMYEKGSFENESFSMDKLQHFDYINACEVSPVFRGFNDGSLHLKYDTLCALVSNMCHVKGGLNWVEDKMIMRGDYKAEDFAILRSIPKRNYNPFGMDRFDLSIVNKYRNIISIESKSRRNVYYQTTDFEKVTVDDSLKSFESYYKLADKSVNKLSLIVAGAGVGKTELLIQDENILIAVPSHILKNELFERMKAKGLDCITTPDVPVFKDKYLNEKYKNLQLSGESKRASSFLIEISKGGTGAFSDEDVEIAKRYLFKLKLSYKAGVTVITTHARISLSAHQFKNKKKLVIDEDYLAMLLPTKNVLKSTLLKSLNSIKSEDEEIKESIKSIKILLDNISQTNPQNIDLEINKGKFIDAIVNQDNTQSLIELLNAEMVVRCIGKDSVESYQYGSKKSYPDCFDKVVMVSATMDRVLYEDIFKGIEFDYWHCGFTENKRPVIQDLSHSYSKYSIESGKRKVILPNSTQNILTYKSHKKDYKDFKDSEYHFGNTVGVDALKGSNITVIGSPIDNLQSTILQGALIGYDIEFKDGETELERDFVEVELENFTITRHTFVNKKLARLETVKAQSELAQSANRGRPVRFECDTVILSSIPLNEADIFIGNKDVVKQYNKSFRDLSTRVILKEYCKTIPMEVIRVKSDEYKRKDEGMCKQQPFGITKVSEIDFSYLEGVKPYNWRRVKEPFKEATEMLNNCYNEIKNRENLSSVTSEMLKSIK